MKTNYKEGELLKFNENGETKLFGLNYTEMVYIEKGTFNIGDNNSGIENEKEATITFESGYFIGKYPVTQEFYQYITGVNPSSFKSKYRPVEKVAYNSICYGDHCFLNQLNNIHNENLISFKGRFFLPSEAQWEYAARGGKTWDKPKLAFAGSNNIHDVAWFSDNSNNRTMPVGLKQPNTLNLYDMSGNIYEWCEDCYVEDYSKNPRDGTSYSQFNTLLALRGGSYHNWAESCKVSHRFYDYSNDYYDFIGFRLVFLPV